MFSEKYGYKQEKQIEYEFITDSLRRRIWNLFYMNDIRAGGLNSERLTNAFAGKPTIEEIVVDKLGLIVNSSIKGINAQGKIEYYITKDCLWYEAYDFIEVHLSCLKDTERTDRIKQYNNLLEEEKSGYRIVNRFVTPIINQTEIDTVQQASSVPYESVSKHISKALELFADRKNPDYDNSVKESISAVESICCIISEMQDRNATLGNAIEKLSEKGLHIHRFMIDGFKNLYKYTSNEGGIRHGGMEYKNTPPEDAKFMLVSCSAFVNYLIEKWNKVKQ